MLQQGDDQMAGPISVVNLTTATLPSSVLIATVHDDTMRVSHELASSALAIGLVFACAGRT